MRLHFLCMVSVLCSLRWRHNEFDGIVWIVCSTVCSGVDQREYQSSASLTFVRGIHLWPMDSPHKGPVTRKMFPFDDVIILRKTNCISGADAIVKSWLYPLFDPKRKSCHDANNVVTGSDDKVGTMTILRFQFPTDLRGVSRHLGVRGLSWIQSIRASDNLRNTEYRKLG